MSADNEAIVDLVELNYAQIKNLYSQLKQLDDHARSLENSNIDDLPISEIKTNDENVQVANLFSSDALPLLLRDYVNGSEATQKSTLEKLLDVVFESPPGFTRTLNFGGLLREYLLTLADVDQLKEFLLNSADITIRSIFANFFYITSELEILLAVLYSRIGEENVRQQFQLADYIPLPRLTAETYAPLEREFDDALQSLAAEQRERKEIVIREARVAEAVIHTTALCEEIENGMNRMMETMADYQRQIAAIDVGRLDHEIVDIATVDTTMLEEWRAGRNAGRENVYAKPPPPVARPPANTAGTVLPYLPPMAQLISTRPKHESADVLQVANVVQTLPLSGEAPENLPPPTVGSECLAKRHGEWFPVIFEGFSISRQPMVRFPNSPLADVVPETSLAFMSPPCWYMKLRDVVVALFENERTGDSVWRSAIVADLPSVSRNGGRYFLLNYFGDARYISYTDIRCLWRPADLNDVWDEIADAGIRDYMQRVLIPLPEKALVRLKRKDTVRVVLQDGLWKKGVVEEIDGLMVKLRFHDGRFRWFYRGDRRLELIYDQHAKEKAQQRPFIARRSRLNGPVIEYVGGSDEDEVLETQLDFDKKVPTARKRSHGRTSKTFGTGPNVRYVDSVPTHRRLRDRESINVVIKTIPAKAPTDDRVSPKTRCDEDCVRPNHDASKYKNENPLLIPMLCGWQRMTEVARTRSRVIYIPPCNHRRLRQERDLQDFLDRTGCRLTIDFFDFKLELDPCRTIEAVSPFVHTPDVSYGRENVRIECVNGYSMEEPFALHYEPARFTTDRTIDLVGAKQFVSGCNCPDNCADPKRCHCQLLTATQAASNKNKTVGYRYRRLPDGHIGTGLYECNQACGCDYRCPNRVVQQPLMNRLQLFQTFDKGWGVRTLADIPKGAFICVYAGNIMSDEFANEVGKKDGDEYFAQLDLIYCAENQKEGYEEEVVLEDSGEEDEGDEGDNHNKRSKRNNGSSDSDDEYSRSSNSMMDRSAVMPLLPPEGAFRSGLRPWLISKYIGEDNFYVLDAKTSGNIGRYLNHSCSPNVFVQNVFVETHDVRLPWVAFFASEFIEAGTELAWDYHYEPMDGRAIKCRCGAKNCRKRLM